MSEGRRKEKSRYDESIWISYFRTIIDVVPSGCEEEPDFNYTSYILFALKSRIVPWLSKHWDPKLSVTFPSIERNNKMYITVVPIRGGKTIDLSVEMIDDLQKEVNRLTAKPLKGALLISSDSFISNPPARQIPSSWIDSILPYLGINRSMNPYLDTVGIIVELDRVIDFYNIYYKLLTNVIDNVRSMFDDGYVVDPSNEIINNWNLISVDEDNRLFHPAWTDRRITERYGGMASFIQSRIMKDPNIDFFVGPKLLYRHQIALMLSKINKEVTFVGQYARIEISNITTARQIACIIDRGTKTGSGKVVVMSGSRESWIMLYMETAHDMGYECLGYMVSDPSRPYMFSCIVPFGTNIQLTTRNIYQKSLAKAVLLEQAIISNLLSTYQGGPISIHDAIEKRYVSVQLTSDGNPHITPITKII